MVKSALFPDYDSYLISSWVFTHHNVIDRKPCGKKWHILKKTKQKQESPLILKPLLQTKPSAVSKAAA